jgi:3-dehydroquinate synthase
MNTLVVTLGERSYPIYIGKGLLLQAELLKKHIKSKQVLVVTNETVAPLYLGDVLAHLNDFQTQIVSLPDGEQYKTLSSLNLIFDQLLAHKFSRNCTLIALGGGVIGDMGGFAAACYQRGVSFIQIPTTLLAQVDSSVGGKTGVNHALGKNMIGAFYQPQAVIIDIDVLATLAPRQFSAGLAEIIKYGLICDAKFFNWLELNIDALMARDPLALTYAIEHACRIKAQIVAEDELEGGIRAILNLGHTFGHAIETGMGYGQYLHGEAVAIGTCLACKLSERKGWLNEQEVERVKTLFMRAQLPTQSPAELSVAQFIDLMSVDKKNIDGAIRVILLNAIGKATLPMDIDNLSLTQTLQHYET